MILEICANSYQSAINAQEAGAHRIELCQKLDVGGLTPSIELFKKVRNELKIPIYVLIRPRAGNFHYSREEFELMLTQIEKYKLLGANGIVCGSLYEENDLNFVQTRLLIEKSRPLPFTFHRAFDEVNDPFKTLEMLVALGADRVLTSGQKTTAEKGLLLLKKLKEQANGRLVILPGSGVSAENITLFKAAEFKEIHASASEVINEAKSNTFLGNVSTTQSSIQKIKAMLKNV